MKLVKRVDMKISPFGSLITKENPQGIYPIFSGEFSSNINSAEMFLDFLVKYVLPKDWKADFWKQENFNIPNQYTFAFTKKNIKIEILVFFSKAGVIANKMKEHKFQSSSQLFYYNFGASINTLNLFRVIIEHHNELFVNEYALSLLKTSLPGVKGGVINKKHNSSSFYVTINSKFSKPMVLNLERDITNESGFKVIGINMQSSLQEEYGYCPKNQQQIEAEIKELQEQLVVLNDYEKFLKGINFEQPTEKKTVSHVNRGEELRSLPRNPLLQEQTTEHLLHLLDQSRKHRYNDMGKFSQFDSEDLRAELSHREHKPKGLSGKAARRAAAQQHHGSKKMKKK